MRRIMVGTAGWAIPTSEAGDFPGQGTHLERYAAALPAVEINSSFYRSHRRTTYERWAASVPAEFRFSVKIPKEISHTRRLVDTDGQLDAFIGEVGGLGAKLGVLLLQLPPSLKFDQNIAQTFLIGLRRAVGGDVGLACEPRHASWFTDEADRCLATSRVARVVADPVLAAGGDQPGGWTGLHYHRLHGSPHIYRSPYGPRRLEPLAAAMMGNECQDCSSWCIFDNTASGAAIRDAAILRDLLEA
ncbi:MAG: DUF72 domain-containing protein [Sphingomonas sp.]